MKTATHNRAGSRLKAVKNVTTLAAPGMPRSGNLTTRLRALNRFREHFNPTVGLTLRVARALFEMYPRGEFADLMWTYGAPMLGIESADPDLLALIERRTGAVIEMDFQIKTEAIEKDDDGAITWPRNFDKNLAAEQKAALREAYSGIANLYEAIEHLCLSTFRGFSLVEKWENGDGDIHRLEIVDHWNVIRDGLKGQWKYNPEAISTTFAALPAENLIDPSAFIIRENRRPVNRIALLKFIRANLSEKDWDAFIEIYGIPSGVVTMPPNVPADRETEYMDAAVDISEGGSGALPNGSTYVPNDSPRGVNPFDGRLRHLSEKLILAGTGGLLTMLTGATGMGSGVSDQHGDAFQTLARKDARSISELFQRSIDAEILARNFPGQDTFAYFTLAFGEEVDSGEVIEDIAKLYTAGFRVDPAQVSEKTGYKVTAAPEPATAPGFGGGAPQLSNRDEPEGTAGEKRGALTSIESDPDLAGFLDTAKGALATATAADLQPLRTALSEALQGTDEEVEENLRNLEARLPELARQVVGSSQSADQLFQIYSAAFASAMATQA